MISQPEQSELTTKNMNGLTHRKFWMLERAHVKKNGEENMKTWKNGRMAYVFGFFLAQGVKMRFPKTDGFSNSNLGCHTFPIPCNNQPNQFLAVINNWVDKTRKVVDNLMGSPSDIWLFPIGPKVWIFPPPLSLGNHAPYHYCCIDIDGCGFLINCIFTWCPKL